MKHEQTTYDLEEAHNRRGDSRSIQRFNFCLDHPLSSLWENDDSTPKCLHRQSTVSPYGCAGIGFLGYRPSSPRDGYNVSSKSEVRRRKALAGQRSKQASTKRYGTIMSWFPDAFLRSVWYGGVWHGMVWYQSPYRPPTCTSIYACVYGTGLPNSMVPVPYLFIVNTLPNMPTRKQILRLYGTSRTCKILVSRGLWYVMLPYIHSTYYMMIWYNTIILCRRTAMVLYCIVRYQ